MAFKIDISCQFASANGFPNGDSPVPALNSNFAEYADVSATTRCFVLAKVAEVYELDPPQPNCSPKLRLRLMDLSGHVRNLTIWPPNCHSELWHQDAVVKLFGPTANMQYHNFQLDLTQWLKRMTIHKMRFHHASSPQNGRLHLAQQRTRAIDSCASHL